MREFGSALRTRPGHVLLGTGFILYVGWLTVSYGGGRIVRAGDAVLLTTLELGAVALVLAGIRPACALMRARGESRRCWQMLGPVLIALAVLAYTVGDVLWSWFDLVRGDELPFPSLADVAYIAGYPLLLLGIWAIPAERRKGFAQVRLVMDGLIVFTVVAAASWFFLIAPTIEAQGPESDIGPALLAAAYPIGDLAIVGCLILLWLRADTTHLRMTMIYLAGGLLVLITADSIFHYLSLSGSYVSGHPIDVGWALGYLLLGIGGRRLLDDLSMPLPEPVAVVEDTRSIWARGLPYLSIPAFGALFVYAWNQQASAWLDLGVVASGVVVSGVVLTTLVVLRQFLEMVENVRLQQSTARYARDLETTNGELRDANSRLASLATTDPLTELANHRGIVARLDQEIERLHRYERPVAALAIDIDHFKAINDGYGHPAGDELLRQFGALLQRHLRVVDALGRWGGEEFVAVLPETDRAQAAEVAERLRAAVAGGTFAVAGGVHLTCSIGVAALPEDGTLRDDLTHAADGALYAAKRLGRNQVRSAGEAAVDALVAELPETREAQALAGTAEALASLVDARDHSTGTHGDAVASLAVRVGLAIGMDATAVGMLRVAGRLHDIGKIAVPDAILRKPGRLTREEWAIMRRHPLAGAEVIAYVPALRAIAPLIRSHHERWDGTGYPDGLAGEVIPLGARILAAVDTYTTIVSDRPYQAARSEAWARDELRRVAGSQLDPAIVDALVRVLEMERGAGADSELNAEPGLLSRAGGD